GMDSRHVIARFEAERQTLAMMEHPNIAKVLDAATTEAGRPYFVMELIQGGPITQHCDKHCVPIRQRLELFITVCRAVQHAHQKGIIHRDIKPANLLVALYDGQPVPKIIDFGISKATMQPLTERTMFTQLGQIIGTLEYMSPEQAQLNQLDIDTRSDVYSLGVVLYELLTGGTPFESARIRGAAFDEMLRMIREDEPLRPSLRLSASKERQAIADTRGLEPEKLRSTVRGELDWIVMKALAKDRGQRYATAEALANDVQRYLAGETVEACPPSATYRLRKLAARNRTAVITLSAIMLSLAVGLVGTVVQWRRAEELARQFQENSQRSDAVLAQQNFETGDVQDMDWRVAKNVPTLSADQGAFEWNYLQRLQYEYHHIDKIDGRRVVDALAVLPVASGHELVVVQDQRLSRYPLPLTPHATPIQNPRDVQYSNYWYWTPAVVIAEEVQWIATVNNPSAGLQDVEPGLLVSSLETYESIDFLSFDEMVRRLANTATEEAKPKDTIQEDADQGDAETENRKPDATKLEVTAICISADGTRIATGHHDGTVAGWVMTADHKLKNDFVGRLHTDAIMSMTCDRSCSTVVAASWDDTISTWDFAAGQQRQLYHCVGPLSGVALSPSGNRVVGVTEKGVIQIISVEDGSGTWHDEPIMCFCAVVSPNQEYVAVGGNDGTIRLLELETANILATLTGHTGGVRKLAYSADGQWLLSGDDRGRTIVRKISEQLKTHSAPATANQGVPAKRAYKVGKRIVFDLAFHKQRNELVICVDNEVKIWDAKTDELTTRFTMGGGTRSIGFSPDGKQAVVSSWAREKATVVFDYLSGEEIGGNKTYDANASSLSNDARYLAMSRDRDFGLKASDLFVINYQTQKALWECYSQIGRHIGYGVDRFALAPSMPHIAYFARCRGPNGYQATLALWDFENNRELWAIDEAHDDDIHNIKFTSDGKRIITSSDDHTIKVWRAEDGRLLTTMRGHRRWVTESVLFPEEKRIASTSVDSTVRIWNLDSGEELFLLQGDGSPFNCVAVSPDGNTLAAGTQHGKVLIWHGGPLN
ncbi:MAG: protein kinase, partial [Planctomycetales bacterium]|nr:protein kinase [Planctomycetales bacterium]